MSPPSADAVAERAAASVWPHARAIAKDALAVLAGQLAVIAFGVTDTVVAGRHSPAALAALSVGSALFISVYVSFNGVFQALLPVWAELHGGKDGAKVGRALRQSLYLWMLASVAGVSVLLAPDPLMRWARVPAELTAVVDSYLRVLAAGLPAALFFRIYATLNQGMGRPQVVSWLQLAALALKIPLSAWLTLGGAGMAAHGAVGCAWATVIVNLLMTMVAALHMRYSAIYRPFQLWLRVEPPDFRQILAFLRLGVPAGLAIMVEVTSFTLMAVFVARQGTVATAAHQIAASLAATLYMVPLSIAIATSAGVSRWIGAQDEANARRAARTGLLGSLGLSCILASVVWLASGFIARLYTSDPLVALTASGLLAWVALYHLADSVQCVCIFVLRSYRVTIAPLVIYSVLLWAAGLGGGYVAAYRGLWSFGPSPTPASFWIASALALGATAAALLLLLRWTLRARARRPASMPKLRSA